MLALLLLSIQLLVVFLILCLLLVVVLSIVDHRIIFVFNRHPAEPGEVLLLYLDPVKASFTSHCI